MEGQTIRWSEGKRTDAGSYFINYWTKGSIDVEAARGWTDSKKELLGEPPIEEKVEKLVVQTSLRILNIKKLIFYGMVVLVKDQVYNNNV